MSENLSQFLVDLASDPVRMASFSANPGAALDGSLLSTEERNAVLTGDSAEVRRVIGAGAGGKGGIRFKKKQSARKTSKKRPAPKKKKS